MTQRRLHDRVRKLESLPPPPSACRAAMRAWEKDGTMPTCPRLRQVVERVAALKRNFKARITVVDVPAEFRNGAGLG